MQLNGNQMTQSDNDNELLHPTWDPDVQNISKGAEGSD